MPTGCGLLIHRMARGNTLKRGAVGALVSLAVAAVLASSDEHTRAVVNRTAALVDSRLVRFQPGEGGGTFG